MQDKRIGCPAEIADEIGGVSRQSVHYSIKNGERRLLELEEKLGSDENSLNLAESLQKLEEELTDFPTFIYDGPYSDHIFEKEPEMLKDAKTVSKNDAGTDWNEKKF